jgi:hypothetical protein
MSVKTTRFCQWKTTAVSVKSDSDVRLAARIPEITELDLNPVIVSPAGAVAVDCRVRVARVPAGAPPGLRRMG